MTTFIDGNILISWGVPTGKRFKDALALAKRLNAEGHPLDTIRTAVLEAFPTPIPVATIARRATPLGYGVAISAETAEDADNITAVRRHMDDLMRCPMIEHGAIMPDACPSGSALGTIPVGGAVVSRAIHPAFHSADICCSMHATVFESDLDTRAIMDALQASTRFGPGGRKPDDQIADPITDEIEATRNPFLTQLAPRAKAQLADQGDGNHFASLGVMRVTDHLVTQLRGNGQLMLADAITGKGQVHVIVTHHGSRDLGAQVYKRGMEVATQHTQVVSPDTPPHQSWIDPDTDDGAAYWDALQYVARWTKRNHELIHARTLARLAIAPLAAFGNEHNFVWKRGDRFFHGKGATPAWRDAVGHPLLGLIPLNMAAPILLTLGRDNTEVASFSPHGAGRNKSRTALLKEQGLFGLTGETFIAESRKLVDRQTKGLDIRFFHDRPDVSESPIAYKSATQVRDQINAFGLADVIGAIQPRGCIMAGDYDKPWMRKR